MMIPRKSTFAMYKLGSAIVVKRRDRPYRSGRSPDWIKVKNPDASAATRILEW
jgi:ATP-dependent DNA ligase